MVERERSQEKKHALSLGTTASHVASPATTHGVLNVALFSEDLNEETKGPLFLA